MRSPLALILIASVAPSLWSQTPPAVVSSMPDGTLHDVAASSSRVWLAQGRALAVLDPFMTHVPSLDIVYDEEVVSVELNAADGVLYVATASSVDVRDPSTSALIASWAMSPGSPKIQDIKFLPGGSIVVLTLDRLMVLSHTGATLQVVADSGLPGTYVATDRLYVHEHSNGAWLAYVIAELGFPHRDVNGLLVMSLKSSMGGPWMLAPLAEWDAASFGSDASVQAVTLVNGPFNDSAYLACGHDARGDALLVQLNLTGPGFPSVIQKRSISYSSGTVDAWNLVKNESEDTIFLATTNRLYRVPIPGLLPAEYATVGFYDAGERDMALVETATDDFLWTATHHNVDYCIHKFQVGPGPQPTHLDERWWIASSDGGVLVSDFDSVYLPTFGGVVRYDISNISNPVVPPNTTVDAYQPAHGPTEHIAYLRIDPSEGYVVTVKGGGGFDAFHVEASDPNPKPAHEEDSAVIGGIYSNDIETYSSAAGHFVLADTTRRSTNPSTYFLEAWQLLPTNDDFQWVASVQIDALDENKNTHSVSVYGNHAFVGAEDLFFVVDLSNLPTSMQVTDVVYLDAATGFDVDGVRGIQASNTHLFVGADGMDHVVMSYAFDPVTGLVNSGFDQPLFVLDSFGAVPLTVKSRLRYDRDPKRLYVPGTSGELFEIDTSSAPVLAPLSVYLAPGGGYVQDCRISKIGGQSHILMVRNNLGFSILTPQ